MSRTIFRCLLFLLIFSPLAFGTVEQWSLTIVEIVSLVSLFLLLTEKSRNREASLYEVPGIIPLLLFLSYILFQLLPLPPLFLKLLSPETYAIYTETVWLDGKATWESLTVNKKATILFFLKVSSYAAFYVVLIQLMTRRNYLRKIVHAVVVTATAIAVFSIFQHILSHNSIYWIRRVPSEAYPFGPYVNRNHYAGFMGMIFPLALGLFLYYRPATSGISLRQRLVEIFSHKTVSRHLLFGFGSVLIATSVFLSLSRGGIISISLAMIFFGTLLLSRKNNPKKGVLILLVSILVLYSVGWFGWEPIFSRFENIRDTRGNIPEVRLLIWKDSLRILRDFPLTGSGFGTFVSIYPRYSSLSVEKIVDHAHNDYIELIAEGGICAVLLAGWFFVSLAKTTFRTFSARRDPHALVIFSGSITGMLTLLIHSFTDFNLHIGANGLYFVFLAALTAASVHVRFLNGNNQVLFKKALFPWRKQAVFLSIVVLILCTAVNTGILTGKYLYAATAETTSTAALPGSTQSHGKANIVKASFFDPFEGRYYFEAGNLDWAAQDIRSALKNYKKAVSLDPLNGEFLQTLGGVTGKTPEHIISERLFIAGIRSERRNPARYTRYALWLLSGGKKEAAFRQIKSAISLDPAKTREYITLLVLYGLGDHDIRNAIPDRVEPHLIFADYLDKTGDSTVALKEYRDTLLYLSNEKDLTPSIFYILYQRYTQKGMINESLEVMKKAVEMLPNDIDLRLTEAEAYEKAGITFRAKEEYQKALLQDPGNAGQGTVSMLSTNELNRVVMLLARLQPSVESLQEANHIIRRGIDGQRFFVTSAFHGVAPLIFGNIRLLEKPDREIFRKFRDSYLYNFADSAKAFHTLSNLSEAFRAEGIDTVPLKGIVWGHEVYGDIALYPSSDIDILIQARNIERATNLMKKLGYIPEREIDRFLLDNDDELHFSRHGEKPVELHFRLGRRRYFDIPEDFWWTDLRQLEIEGKTFSILSKENNLLYASVHLFRHGCTPLKFIVTIAEMLRLYKKDLDWEGLYHNYQEVNTSAPLLLACALSEALLNAPIPEYIAERLNMRSLKELYIHKKIQGYVFDREASYAKIMALLTILRYRGSEVPIRFAEWLFPPRDEIERRYGLPQHSLLFPLYFLLNPILLLLRRREL